MPYHVVFDIEADIERAAIFELERTDENPALYFIKKVMWAGKNINNSITSRFFQTDCDLHTINSQVYTPPPDAVFDTFEEAKAYLKLRYVELMIDKQDYLLFEVVKTQRRLQENFIKFTEIVPKLDQIIVENEKK